MAAEIRYKASVEKDLRRLDPKTANRILTRIENTLLADSSVGKPLSGAYSGLLSMRVGDYRVVCSRHDTVILVLRIAHRKEVYR